MSIPDLEQLRFPVGRFSRPTDPSEDEIRSWIDTISAFSDKLKEITSGLSEEQLNWTYRPDGWMIRQVVHHCADSHMNSFIRYKLALTENQPTIRPYEEAMWAELDDTLRADIQYSLDLLDALHKRWTVLLNSLGASDWSRTFIHPEHGTKTSLAQNTALYAWHCNHHLAHIEQAIKYQGSFE